LSITNFNKN